MADYFAHWLAIGAKADGAKLPRIFYVNWFRKSADGKFLWPGYGENCRVLKWVFERVNGDAQAMETPIGNLPTAGSLDVSGLGLGEREVAELLRVDVEGWLAQMPLIKKHYEQFGPKLPQGLEDELAGLERRLQMAAVGASR
jgi:phosphoenolpyruvate carboxykinase (GTP)